MRADSVITTGDAEMSNKHHLHEKHFIAFGRGMPAVVNCGVLQKSRATHRIKHFYELFFLPVKNDDELKG